MGSRADVAGTIKTFDAPAADLTVKSSIDAARVAPLAGAEEPVGGNVTINATVRGPLSTPTIEAHVSGSALQFRDLRDVQLDADAAYQPRHSTGHPLVSAGPRPLGRRERHGTHRHGSRRAVAYSGGYQRRGRGHDHARTPLPYVAATRVNGKLQAEWPGLEYLQAKGTADAT